jgi:hypothetical protein
MKGNVRKDCLPAPQAAPSPKATLICEINVPLYSTLTKSLTTTNPIDIVPPAPIPHTALAIMKYSVEFDNPHHKFVKAKIVSTSKYTDFRPMVSLSRPQSGWKPVLVIMKAVVSHDALLDAWK